VEKRRPTARSAAPPEEGGRGALAGRHLEEQLRQWVGRVPEAVPGADGRPQPEPRARRDAGPQAAVGRAAPEGVEELDVGHHVDVAGPREVVRA
jgi:hypothetical protein